MQLFSLVQLWSKTYTETDGGGRQRWSLSSGPFSSIETAVCSLGVKWSAAGIVRPLFVDTSALPHHPPPHAQPHIVLTAMFENAIEGKMVSEHSLHVN